MIKKLITYCFCLLTIPAFAQTQKYFLQDISIGGSAGVALASVSFSPTVQKNMMMTYTMGATARWITEKHCGIQLEVNYAQQGWDEQFEDPQYHFSRRLNYIEIPFMSHFYVGNRRVRVIFNVGPQIGYMLAESTSHNLPDLNEAYEPNRHSEQHTKAIEHKFSWGLGGGPGLEVQTGIGNFIIEGRYFYSLGDIYKNGKEDYFARSAPQTIYVKLIYLIPFLKRYR